MVYYRKYRPQTISELDSNTVREKLLAALSSPSVSHAFLFTGPKGLGKTSAARIVAKAINCEKKGKNIEPCNKCEQCISITNGTNLDVLEIDGASNRGIDEIRDLRDKIRLSPLSAKKKVYIIDEVHMLTTEAFNALLKTLEEPPPHALFILCTTEPQKLPATIVSRCFHIPFTRATDEELVRSLTRIVKMEKQAVDKEALLIIAKLSDGSFRDGTKILEEMVSISDGKITKELVEEKYQISNIKYQISQMLEFLEKKDAKEGLQLVSKLVEQGVDMKYFIEQMISVLHEELLSQVRVEKETSRIQEIKSLVELLTKAHQEIKYAVLPQLPLELAIIEWVFPHSEHSEYSERSDKSENQNVQKVRNAGSQSSSESSDLWYQLLDAVKKHNHSLAGVLRGCNLLRYDDKELIIETRYKFHKDKLEEKKAREILEKVIKDLSGKEIKVLAVLKEKGGDK